MLFTNKTKRINLNQNDVKHSYLLSVFIKYILSAY